MAARVLKTTKSTPGWSIFSRSERNFPHRRLAERRKRARGTLLDFVFRNGLLTAARRSEPAKAGEILLNRRCQLRCACPITQGMINSIRLAPPSHVVINSTTCPIPCSQETSC